MTPFAFLPNIGAPEIIVLLIIGILLFGRKLPEVGRYLGKGIVEFKKGIKGIEDDVETSAPAGKIEPQAAESPRPPQKIGVTAPKFEEVTKNVAVTTPPQI